MISETSQPWVVSFLLALLQSALSVFLLYFLDQYAWLRNLPILFVSLRWIGIIMIAFAGLLCAIQTNLGKTYGYLVLFETGYSLLALGLMNAGGLNYLAILFVPRLFSYAVLSLALSVLCQESGADVFAFSSQDGFF